ncbi:MAG: hypothetical protein R2939_11100 [Kofleriaceae bacterium]
MTTAACQACLDAMASLLDDDAAALAAHADHLATCEACRDARHDAETLARGGRGRRRSRAG